MEQEQLPVEEPTEDVAEEVVEEEPTEEVAEETEEQEVEDEVAEATEETEGGRKNGRPITGSGLHLKKNPWKHPLKPQGRNCRYGQNWKTSTLRKPMRTHYLNGGTIPPALKRRQKRRKNRQIRI